MILTEMKRFDIFSLNTAGKSNNRLDHVSRVGDALFRLKSNGSGTAELLGKWKG